MDRQTDRQKDKWIEGQTDRQKDRPNEGQTERGIKDRLMERLTDK